MAPTANWMEPSDCAGLSRPTYIQRVDFLIARLRQIEGFRVRLPLAQISGGPVDFSTILHKHLLKPLIYTPFIDGSLSKVKPSHTNSSSGDSVARTPSIKVPEIDSSMDSVDFLTARTSLESSQSSGWACQPFFPIVKGIPQTPYRFKTSPLRSTCPCMRR